MKKVTITIGDKSYPCMPTMGAMMRFRQETGREVTEIKAESLSDLCTYLYCCVVSASAREGVEFNMTLMEFADSISPDEMAAWNAALADGSGAEGAEANDEKKSL